MKKLPRNGKMLPLIGLIVEGFAYRAELGLYLTGRRSSGRILNIQGAEWSDLQNVCQYIMWKVKSTHLSLGRQEILRRVKVGITWTRGQGKEQVLEGLLKRLKQVILC